MKRKRKKVVVTYVSKKQAKRGFHKVYKVTTQYLGKEVIYAKRQLKFKGVATNDLEDLLFKLERGIVK